MAMVYGRAKQRNMYNPRWERRFVKFLRRAVGSGEGDGRRSGWRTGRQNRRVGRMGCDGESSPARRGMIYLFPLY
jgi:hypothetical protein